jgi:hypothetical protein
VDKNLLLGIAKTYGSDSVENAEAVLLLRNQFPFSQVLQVLAAKLGKDLNLPSYQKDLQNAAVYATDRSVLKYIMEEPFSQVITQQRAHETVADAPVEIKTETKNEVALEREPSTSTIDASFDGLDVAERVMSDLKKLNEARHNFEMLFVDDTVVSTPVAENVEHDKSGLSQKISELTKDISPSDTPVTVTPKRRKKEQQVDHNILDEIKISKEEIALETERQKQQIELIDQFIKAQPSISANNVKEKPVGTPPTDLNSIKSGEFSDNIISETLVEILLKQGKKERAIEVLKKLIWKYPQKKAYFASRIEDLKK